MNGMHVLWGLVAAAIGFALGVYVAGPRRAVTLTEAHVVAWNDSTAECRVAGHPELGIAISCWPRRRLR